MEGMRLETQRWTTNFNNQVEQAEIENEAMIKAGSTSTVPTAQATGHKKDRDNSNASNLAQNGD
jgi:hypothetical protein